ncbi:AAA family ATPase [Acinetobacter towneri]|uniref:AAA family ATPase n=1 Tax=Acinetobacter towneri TaxID=202956 RepID=UPI002936B0DB|nr:AAA family ATPase [Acinetobacter towneri]MDV2456605.1 AAA family ATPase [Acinetobacter towneri]
MSRPIKHLKIFGYKSLKNVDIELSKLNVLIGANGVGKSNLVSYFRLLSAILDKRLQIFVAQQGGAERLLCDGIKSTDEISTEVYFGRNGYLLTLKPTVNGELYFDEERTYFAGDSVTKNKLLGTGHKESLLPQFVENHDQISKYCYDAIKKWRIYHFHDTSDTATVKRACSVHDSLYLRPSAENLAAFLYRMKQQNESHYKKIVKVIGLAIPSFDDFVLEPKELSTGEEQLRLIWKQKGSDYQLWPSQFSDGSLRFICLATALLQPDPPTTIIIDEPELGLHPYAITLLGGLLKSASERMQVIISTQSVPLVDQFELENLIIVERDKEGTKFKKLDVSEYANWLEDYSTGELWEKNILGGRPTAW